MAKPTFVFLDTALRKIYTAIKKSARSACLKIDGARGAEAGSALHP
jgi:hypothetical protein